MSHADSVCSRRVCSRWVCSRRVFLATIPSICAAAGAGKGSLLPSAVFRYSDPATDLPVFRLTDPEHTSALPPHYARAISKKGNFLLYASDESGSSQAYRLDLKSGQARLLTDAEHLDPACVTLMAGDRSFCYVDGGSLYLSSLGIAPAASGVPGSGRVSAHRVKHHGRRALGGAGGKSDGGKEGRALPSSIGPDDGWHGCHLGGSRRGD